MANVDLLSMEASDFVDVLHAEFENYFTFYGEEHAASASAIRKSVWNNLYGQPFKYEIKTRSQQQSSPGSYRGSGMTSASGYEMPTNFDDSDFSSVSPTDPFSPRRSENGEEIKPYFPPTQFDPDSPNPFPGIDGPLN